VVKRFLIALVCVFATATFTAAGGYGHYSYSYSSYPSYSYPTYSYPSYPVSYPVYIDRYVDRVKYVEKPYPVYVAQYAPLLVNVPTYSAGYSPAPPCQQPAQQYVNQPQQQQHFPAPAAAPTTQAPSGCPHAPAPAASAPAAVSAVTPAPCEKAMAEYRSQLDELKKDLVALRSTLSRPAPREAETTPGESRGEGQREERQPFRGAAPRLRSALEVFTYKCAMCHSDKTAATEGDKFVLLKSIPRGEGQAGDDHLPFKLADLTDKQWDKVVELTQSQKMPKKPKGVNDSTFDRLGRLTQEDFDLVVEEANRAKSAKRDKAR
jgi:hypothetical protein